jgi:hypothetical protein
VREETRSTERATALIRYVQSVNINVGRFTANLIIYPRWNGIHGQRRMTVTLKVVLVLSQHCRTRQDF